MFLTHEMARTYVFDLALDAEDGLVGGSAEVDDPVVQPLVLPDMNELLPCLCESVVHIVENLKGYQGLCNVNACELQN